MVSRGFKVLLARHFRRLAGGGPSIGAVAALLLASTMAGAASSVRDEEGILSLCGLDHLSITRKAAGMLGVVGV